MPDAPHGLKLTPVRCVVNPVALKTKQLACIDVGKDASHCDDPRLGLLPPPAVTWGGALSLRSTHVLFRWQPLLLACTDFQNGKSRVCSSEGDAQHGALYYPRTRFLAALH